MGEGTGGPPEPILVAEEPITTLAAYAGVSSAFRVDRVLSVVTSGRGPAAFSLSESPLDIPYVKDYDALDGGPARWAGRFDVSRWGLLTAREGGRRVGGTVLAFDTPGLDMLEGCRDMAVLWDIRVSPDCRGRGIGSALFRAAEAWAGARGCRQLKVETQSNNVIACRLYARQGCVLASVTPSAYRELPEEIQLIWLKDIGPPAAHGPAAPGAAMRRPM